MPRWVRVLVRVRDPSPEDYQPGALDRQDKHSHPTRVGAPGPVLPVTARHLYE